MQLLHRLIKERLCIGKELHLLNELRIGHPSDCDCQRCLTLLEREREYTLLNKSIRRAKGIDYFGIKRGIGKTDFDKEMYYEVKERGLQDFRICEELDWSEDELLRWKHENKLTVYGRRSKELLDRRKRLDSVQYAFLRAERMSDKEIAELYGFNEREFREFKRSNGYKV